MAKGDKKLTILNIAARHFADHGFEGARMDRIAKDANVNKATIYYKIGNKQDLYTAVMNHTFEGRYESLKEAVESEISVQEKLQAYILHIAQGLRHNPTISKIIMREQLSQGENLPDSFVQNVVLMLNCLTDILDQGSKEGVFEPADTVTIHFMILGAMVFQMTSSPIRKSKKAFPDRYHADPGILPESVVKQISRSIIKAVKKEE